MKRLIECVPNFSEGRDLARIDAIAAAMSAVPGVTVLDRHSDADHHRSVITIAGEPQAVAESALRGIGRAAELIDLTRHAGAHPRIGATDVVPFVPVEGVTLEECVALAKTVGREIWERFGIPVYFYEAAAQRPERVNLENVRNGQFEVLREQVLLDPHRAPDIGERRLHPTAGAIAVGARKFLIAYNINLNTSDVALAQRIARKIRFSSGGLPFVKAMAVDLRSRHLAQVSMNLTDFEQTPMHLVFETVKREADSLGVTIAGSEIVGLVPRRALEMVAADSLQLENFSPDQVLENCMESSLRASQPADVPEQPPGSCSPHPASRPETSPSLSATMNLAALAQPFLHALAASNPAAAGVSVTALAADLAAALGEKVAAISLKEKSPELHTEQLKQVAAEIHAAAQSLALASDGETSSHTAVIAAPQAAAAGRMPPDVATQQTLILAVEVSLEVARRSARVFELLGQLESLCSPSMIADVRIGLLLASSAARAALETTTMNLASIADPACTARVRSESKAILSRLAEIDAATRR